MEIFCTRIPPSKNNFRAKVPRQPELPSRVVGDGFALSKVGIPMGDLEMGRKPIWNEDVTSTLEEQFRNDDNLDKDAELSIELSIVSPELSRITLTETTEGRSILHSRRSSWARRSGSLDISPEIGSSSSPVPKESEIFQLFHQQPTAVSPELVAMASRIGDTNQIMLGERLTKENHQ